MFEGEAQRTYEKTIPFTSQGSVRDSFISETHLKNNWLSRLEIFVPILAKFRVPVSPVLFFEILRGHIAARQERKSVRLYRHVREKWY